MRAVIVGIVGFSIGVFAQEPANFDLYNRVNSDWNVARTNAAVYANYMTDDLWIDYVNQLIATNMTLGVAKRYETINILDKIARIANVRYGGEQEERLAFLDDFDDRIARAKIIMPLEWYVSHHGYIYQKSHAAWFANNADWCAKHPVSYMLWTRNPNTYPGKRTVAERINHFAEVLAVGGCRQEQIKASIKSFSNEIMPAIRRNIREKGGTFVVGEDKKNPLQQYVDEFIGIMQSPNHAGLVEYVAKYYPDYEWIPVPYMTKEEGDKLKEDVFYGDIEFTSFVATRLQTYLGLDAYNEFIEIYNNGTGDAQNN